MVLRAEITGYASFFQCAAAGYAGEEVASIIKFLRAPTPAGAAI